MYIVLYCVSHGTAGIGIRSFLETCVGLIEKVKLFNKCYQKREFGMGSLHVLAEKEVTWDTWNL